MNNSKFKLISKAIVLFFIFLVSTVLGQNPTLSEYSKLSILTCGTGNESYSLFGHTAIRITDKSNQIDVVYNYGAFDFSTPNFIAKFTKGDLQYFVNADSYIDFIKQYLYEKRSVYEQELNIPLAYKQKIFDNLNLSLYSDAKYYTYKFIDRNCTTMMVDLLNKNLGENVIVKIDDLDKTYRSILYPYFDNQFYYKLGTSIIFGSKVDKKSTTVFLPFELLNSLKVAKFQNHLLCKPVEKIVEFETKSYWSWWNNIYSYLLLLGLIVIINKKWVDYLYFLIMATFGLFFSLVGFYSFHLELENNYNILLFNPTLFLLLYFIYKKNKKWVTYLSVFNLISIAIYLTIVAFKAPFLIVLPLALVSSLVIGKYVLRYWKKQNLTSN